MARQINLIDYNFSVIYKRRILAGWNDPRHCADTLHDSWKLLFGFPRSRTVPANAWVANSVQIRATELAAYRLSNLKFDAANKLIGYTIVNVVSDPT
jgi:hypothetical protein